MANIKSFLAGVRALFRKAKDEADLDDELRDYLEAAVAEKVKAGMNGEEARRMARLEMGSAEGVKEGVRCVGWEIAVETFWQDVLFAGRMMRKNPSFTLIAVLTLALGMGANTAIFSVVNAVLLQPMPYKDADRLVMIWGESKARGYDPDLVSYPDYLDWKSQNRLFQSMGASTDQMYTMTGAGDPVALIGYQFSPDFFDVLGVAPLLGRTFASDEDQPGRNHVVVLNYRLWKTRFGGDDRVVGRSVTLDGQNYVVIGVMPRTFQWPQSVELWTPLLVDPAYAKGRSMRWLRVMARLKPGVTFEQAQAAMETIAAQLRSAYPTSNKDYDVNLESLRQMTSGDVRPALLILLCSVGLVLLIACGNIANLLLSRGVARRQEVAIRAALGASRARIIRQFVTESVLLALAGGALGLLIAYWGAHALVGMFPATVSNLQIPRVETIPIDRWVLGFALLVSVLTGIVFGLAPALRASRQDAAESLKESGRAGAGDFRGTRLRNVFVVTEVALSLVLLIAAGLTIQSVVHLVRADLGFRPDHVLTMRMLLPSYKYKADAQRKAFASEALSRIQSLPGVEAAGTVTFLPLSGWWGTREVSVAGRPIDPAQKNPRPVWSSVSPDYFQAMKIPLLEGRYFTAQDDASNADVAILSAGLARHLWPNQDSVGRQVNVEGFSKPCRVVGVVGDVFQLGVGVQPGGSHSGVKSEIYVPYDQSASRLLCFTVRMAGDPLSAAKTVQTEIWAVDKEQAISFMETLEQLASETIVLQQASAILMGFFAGLALILASIGLYGVISYSTSRRTHEIGIRMALGARAADILRMVIGEGLALTLAGVALGLAGAFGLVRFLSSLLYGVRSSDPATFIAIPPVLVVVALVACYIPARRAMRVDPMIALRYE